jgi:hypothetical protein
MGSERLGSCRRAFVLLPSVRMVGPAQIGPDRTGVGLGSGQLELHRNGIGLGRASLIGSASGRLLRVGSASGRLALI